MYGILKIVSLSLVATTSIAVAQETASPFTYGKRYDAMRRETGTIAPDPDGTEVLRYLATRQTYDASGNLIRLEKGQLQDWQSDATAPENWTNFTVLERVDTEYDGMQRRIVERSSGNGILLTVTQYSYNTVGLVECIAIRMKPTAFASSLPEKSACTLSSGDNANPDAADRITKNIYDPSGQLVQVRRGVGTTNEQAYVTYSYTANGKRDQVIDANGARARLEYDSYDRLKKWFFPSATRSVGFDALTPKTATDTAAPSNENDYEAYDYDANGNRTLLRRRDWRELTFTYDALNQVASKVVPKGCALDGSSACPGDTALRSVYYGYDLLGHQTYARFDNTTSAADGVTNDYDGFGELISSTLRMDKFVQTVTSKYDANGNRISVTTPAGTWSYDYDGLDRMIALKQGSGSSATSQSKWTYNTQGLPLRVTESGGSSVDWTYDGLGRPASQTDSFVGGTGNVMVSLERNAAGQISKRTRNNATYVFTDAYAIDRSYTPNGLNQYAQTGGIKHDYDSNGNLINESTTRDANGQLISDGKRKYIYDAENRLVSANGNTTLTYDPLGRLFEVNAPSGKTQFLYDGDQLSVEYDASGWTNAYVHGPGEDDPLIRYQPDGQTRWLHRNEQGSVVAVASPTGTLERINTYDDYGIPGSNNAGRFQYTGQAWIPELGLYHYKARLYSPTLGRFLQTDPIGYDDQINLYAYVANDPVNGRDPSGNSTVYRYPDGTVVVVQTFDNQTAGKTNVPISDASIVAQGDKFSGQTNGHYMSVVLQPGNDADAVHIKVDPSLNDQGAKRSNSDLGGREIRLAPNAVGPITAGHELGHSMKAGDLYAGGGGADGKTVPSNVPGTAGTIMRDYGGLPAAQQTRDEIHQGLNDQRNTQRFCSVTALTTECK